MMQACISISLSFIIHNNTITSSDLFIDTFISRLHKYGYALDAPVWKQPFMLFTTQ